jgi:hypothetical protein
LVNDPVTYDDCEYDRTRLIALEAAPYKWEIKIDLLIFSICGKYFGFNGHINLPETDNTVSGSAVKPVGGI